GTSVVYPPGRSLEFEAKFTSAPFQQIGFANDYNDVGGPWVDFSTSNTGQALYVRVNNDVRQLAGTFLNSYHRYRIEWTPVTSESSTSASAKFLIDGVEQMTITSGIPAVDLRPLASDFRGADGNDLRIKWLRMSPYAGSGTFTS